MTRNVFLVALVMSMANFFAYAEQDEDNYIRIARISYMEGPVSFQQTSDPEWTAASINLPLRPGDRIYTGPEGRAEIQFDEGSVFRLAEETDIQFLSLSEDLIQIRIIVGLSSLTLSSGTSFEMDTPAAAFIALRRGLYRFDTRDNGDTNGVVRKGELEMISHRFVRRVESGEQIFVKADENSSYNISLYSRLDAWDEWNDRRDADLIARTSRQYLPNNVYVGVSDLDRYGRWVTVESYGTAWVPFSVGVSWSPYSVGRWCYRPVWGWTWVSYEPWGWLPYHYGRWYRSPGFGWCWLPGPSFSFNFWSPGLVTFYYGPSWVSWCPLGPGDYYSINNYYYNRKLYRRDLGRLRQLHRRSPGHSINQHVRGAFRTADMNRFRNGGSRAVATPKGYRSVEQPWKRGTLVRERLAVRPTAKSFSADPDRRAVRSKLNNPRPAVVHNTPSVKAAQRNGYVRITNPEVTSRAVARLRNGSVSGSGSTFRESESGRIRVLSTTPSKSVGSAKARSTTRTVVGDLPDRRIVRSNNETGRMEGDQSARSTERRGENQSAARTDSRQSSNERKDGSIAVRSAAPRNSSRTGSGGNSSERSRTGNGTQSSPSVSRIQSTTQSGFTARRSIRTYRSSGQPGVSRSSSSSSRARSYSAPSSNSRSRSYAAPSSSSRSRSYSAPSSSSRARSYSTPSSSGRSRSYSAPSSGSGSSARSSSPPSSGSARSARRR